MSRILGFAVGVVSTVLMLTPAFSADMAVKPRAVERPAPVVQASNWSGGQIGGNGGGSIGNNNFVDPGSIVCFAAGLSCPETPFNFSGHPNSFIGGVFIGYRWQMGNSVLGVEGDATWQDLKTSASQSSITLIPGGFRSDAFSGSVKQRWEGSIRARYGWLATPMILLYVTGGVSFGEVSGSFSYTGSVPAAAPTATVAGAGSWSDTRVGYTVGAGVESDVSGLFGVRGLKARFEYRFTDYGSYSKDIALGCTGVSCGVAGVYRSTNSHIEVSDIYNHKIMAGLGFDF
jgi:outer membrane immunogenic protein